MKLMVISDVHGHTGQVPAMHKACEGVDALIMCGDFTTFGPPRQIQRVADTLRVPDRPCFFVIGNCDCMAIDGSLDGWVNLHARCVPLGEWTLTGLGGALPCPAQTPTELPESAYVAHLDRLLTTCETQASRVILAVHQPPYGTSADLLPNGIHVGSHALRAFIDGFQPACCLSGHIHEAASRSRCGSTLVVNPGPFAKGNFAIVEL